MAVLLKLRLDVFPCTSWEWLPAMGRGKRSQATVPSTVRKQAACVPIRKAHRRLGHPEHSLLRNPIRGLAGPRGHRGPAFPAYPYPAGSAWSAVAFSLPTILQAILGTAGAEPLEGTADMLGSSPLSFILLQATSGLGRGAPPFLSLSSPTARNAVGLAGRASKGSLPVPLA